jgi:toxin ParE1/3/4
MRVAYSGRALREVERIARMIATDNPRAADDFVAQLEHRCSLLSAAPEMGPARPDIGHGVRSLVQGNYSIFYRLNSKRDTALILSVWHSRRRPPRL